MAMPARAFDFLKYIPLLSHCFIDRRQTSFCCSASRTLYLKCDHPAEDGSEVDRRSSFLSPSLKHHLQWFFCRSLPSSPRPWRLPFPRVNRPHLKELLFYVKQKLSFTHLAERLNEIKPPQQSGQCFSLWRHWFSIPSPIFWSEGLVLNVLIDLWERDTFLHVEQNKATVKSEEHLPRHSTQMAAATM